MERPSTAIDFEFGLKQLNGNQELLFRLLRKFAAEYQNLEERLNSFFSENNFNGAELLIHTLKGVSGNLGCFAVYESSRQVNRQLKNGQTDSESMQRLIKDLNITVELIDTLPDQTTANPAGSCENSNENSAAKTLLIDALKNHEFISDDKLMTWTKAMALDPVQIETLTDAIATLEYDFAIELLNDSTPKV